MKKEKNKRFPRTITIGLTIIPVAEPNHQHYINILLKLPNLLCVRIIRIVNTAQLSGYKYFRI
jgi:hypothetical protein